MKGLTPHVCCALKVGVHLNGSRVNVGFVDISKVQVSVLSELKLRINLFWVKGVEISEFRIACWYWRIIHNFCGMNYSQMSEKLYCVKHSYPVLTCHYFSTGWTRLSRLKIHLHRENNIGLQRLPCFNKRTRHRTFMKLTGKIIHSKNYCSNCNHYKRLSKRKLIKSNQPWLLSMSTERTPTSFIVTRCQNS